MLQVSCLWMSMFIASTVGMNGYRVLEKISDQCLKQEDLFKCLKIQAIKIAHRASQLKSLSLYDGVSLVNTGGESRSINSSLNLNESALQNLENEQLDNLLEVSAKSFFENRRLEVKIPELVEEGRRKKNKGGGGNAALYWALAIKGTFLAVAYKGIAIMSGLSLIMGKMALLLTAILGLKKLVSSGQETTTFEIIKQPKYSESHTHSTSYEDDDEYHHRAYDVGSDKASRRIIRTHL